MDGLELIQQLRQSTRLKNKVIIVTSASTYEEDKRKSLAIGSNAFLPKPIQVERFFKQLQHHLELTWIYRDKARETVAENHATPMMFPPLAELKELYELSLNGDVDELEEYINILGKSDVNLKSFIAQVQTFIKEYQVEELSEWLEREITDDK